MNDNDGTVSVAYIECDEVGCDLEVSADCAPEVDVPSVYTGLALAAHAAGWDVELPYSSASTTDFCPFHRRD